VTPGEERRDDNLDVRGEPAPREKGNVFGLEPLTTWLLIRRRTTRARTEPVKGGIRGYCESRHNTKRIKISSIEKEATIRHLKKARGRRDFALRKENYLHR